MDLKDECFHIPIHPDHVLSVCYKGELIPVQGGPDTSLTTCPQVFTKMRTPVMGYLRIQGVKVFGLNNILFATIRLQLETSLQHFVVAFKILYSSALKLHEICCSIIYPQLLLSFFS